MEVKTNGHGDTPLQQNPTCAIIQRGCWKCTCTLRIHTDADAVYTLYAYLF